MSDTLYDFIEYKKIFKDREKRLKLIHKLSFIPTPLYLRLVYFIKTGRILHLNNPTGFSEKIQWLKINDKHPDYSIFVDKYEVKKLIAKNFGEKYVFPCYGVWDRYEDIDFSALPDQFVLKCTHDSGSIKIIPNKYQMDHDALQQFFTERLSRKKNISREYLYDYVKPRLIAEYYCETAKNHFMPDYKFFCFDGVPKIVEVITSRNTEHESGNWFDIDFNPLDITDVIRPEKEPFLQKPTCFDAMADFAHQLSSDMRFVRVDLYENEGNYFFGEMTFFPYGGFVLLKPEKWEKTLGEWIRI